MFNSTNSVVAAISATNSIAASAHSLAASLLREDMQPNSAIEVDAHLCVYANDINTPIAGVLIYNASYTLDIADAIQNMAVGADTYACGMQANTRVMLVDNYCEGNLSSYDCVYVIEEDGATVAEIYAIEDKFHWELDQLVKVLCDEYNIHMLSTLEEVNHACGASMSI